MKTSFGPSLERSAEAGFEVRRRPPKQVGETGGKGLETLRGPIEACGVRGGTRLLLLQTTRLSLSVQNKCPSLFCPEEILRPGRKTSTARQFTSPVSDIRRQNFRILSVADSTSHGLGARAKSARLKEESKCGRGERRMDSTSTPVLQAQRKAPVQEDRTGAATVPRNRIPAGGRVGAQPTRRSKGERRARPRTEELSVPRVS